MRSPDATQLVFPVVPLLVATILAAVAGLLAAITTGLAQASPGPSSLDIRCPIG